MGATMREHRYGVVTATLTPSEVSAATTEEHDFTVTGLTTDMMVFVNKPTLDAGLACVGARVKAANTLSLQFVNPTAGALTPTAESYTIFWFKPERTFTAVNP